MFDIRKLAPTETAFMQLADIEGEPQFAEDGSAPGIEFYGPGTREHRAAQSAYFVKLKKLEDAKKGNDVEELLKARREFLTRITKRLVGFEFEGGAAALFQDDEYQDIFSQANKFTGDQGNFKKSS